MRRWAAGRVIAINNASGDQSLRTEVGGIRVGSPRTITAQAVLQPPRQDRAVVVAAAGSGASRTYGAYWARMATAWADRRLDEVYASDIEAMKNTAATTARSRRTTRHGRHAGEHVVAAARAIYNRAIADGLIDQKDSPAHRVAKPRRLPNTRRALTAWELDQINTTARVSGNDAALDALLLRLHTETACRRDGALGVHLEDLDPDRRLVSSGKRTAPSVGNPSPQRSPTA